MVQKGQTRTRQCVGKYYNFAVRKSPCEMVEFEIEIVNMEASEPMKRKSKIDEMVENAINKGEICSLLWCYPPLKYLVGKTHNPNFAKHS